MKAAPLITTHSWVFALVTQFLEPPDVTTWASANGVALSYLLTLHQPPDIGRYVLYAISNKDIGMFALLTGPPYDPALCSRVVESGFTEALGIMIIRGGVRVVDDDTILEKAVKSDSADTVSLILRHRKGNWEQQEEDAALLHAVRSGNLEICQLLLYHGFDPSISDNQTLYLAAQAGNVPMVQLLLDQDRTDTNANHSEALCEAIRQEDKAMIDVFLQQNDVDINSHIIVCAIKVGNVAILQKILTRRPPYFSFHESQSAFLTALHYSQDRIIPLLISCGMVPAAITIDYAESVGKAYMLQLSDGL